MDRSVHELFVHSPDIDLSLVSAERHADACKKRTEQLKHWETSELYLTPLRANVTDAKIRFDSFECFIDAVKKHDLEYVRSFLRSGQDINGPIVDGLTAIHQAVLCSDLELIKLLVESGADVNVKDVYGWTPLHASVYTKDSGIVQYLVDKGADPLCVNIDLEFPVDICEQLWSDEEVSSSSRFKLKEMKKILLTAIGDTDVDYVRDGEQREMLQDARELLENPDKPVPICSDNSTPIHVAASKGYLDVLKVLVEHTGLDINARDTDGWTPLHAALFFEQEKAAEVLVMSGASLTSRTNMNETLEDVCSDEMFDIFTNLKNQQPNYGSGLGSIGKRRPSFPLRALRAGSIDQKDKDNERHIMELRSSEDLSPEESPEPSRKPIELSTPGSLKGYSHTSRPSDPIAESPISASDPHLPRPLERFDPSEKYSHYGPRTMEGRRTSHPVLPIRGDKQAPVFSIRELGPSKPSPKPLPPLNGPSANPLSVPTRRVRSDADLKYIKPTPEASNESPPRSSLVSTQKTYTPSSKITPKQAVSTPPSVSGTPAENVGISRSTSSEIARKTTSRKSLDGRRKTQPVDPESLAKAMEDLSNNPTTGEVQRNAAENGNDPDPADPISPKTLSQDTPNSKTETRFRLTRVPSKEMTGHDFTPSERRVLRDSSQTHFPSNNRQYSDLGRTPSQSREQKPWPVNSRVSAIIGSFEKSDRAAPPPAAPPGSSSGSAVSLDSFLREETGEKQEVKEKESASDDTSPTTARRDRTNSSCTTRRISKQPRRSTGISQEEVMESIAREAGQAISNNNQQSATHTSHPPLSHSTYNTNRYQEYNRTPADPEKLESEQTNNNNTSSHSNSKEDRSTSGDIPFLKKLYEQDQISIKKLHEELTQLKIDKEMALSNIQKLEKLVSQINRRLSDTTRAYEQEKKERTRLDLKLKQLELSEQRNHHLEAEKQRTEDENKKLIEVIKSLSGTSF